MRDCSKVQAATWPEVQVERSGLESGRNGTSAHRVIAVIEPNGLNPMDCAIGEYHEWSKWGRCLAWLGIWLSRASLAGMSTL